MFNIGDEVILKYAGHYIPTQFIDTKFTIVTVDVSDDIPYKITNNNYTFWVEEYQISPIITDTDKAKELNDLDYTEIYNTLSVMKKNLEILLEKLSKKE